MPQPVLAPAGYVPVEALSFADAAAQSVNVTRDTPLPVDDRPFGGFTAIVPGTDQTPQRALFVNTTAAGVVRAKLANDTTVDWPVEVGVSVLPLAAKTVVVAGTTATATYGNLS